MAKQYYKDPSGGIDLYDASTGQRITGDDWNKNWVGQDKQMITAPRVSSTPIADIGGGLSLPESPAPQAAPFSALKSMLKKITDIAYRENLPSIETELAPYREPGKILHPSVAGDILRQNYQSRAAQVKNIYETTLDLVKEQEASRQTAIEKSRELLLKLGSGGMPEVFNQLSPEEVEGLYGGIIYPTVYQKMNNQITLDQRTISKWRDQNPEAGINLNDDIPTAQYKIAQANAPKRVQSQADKDAEKAKDAYDADVRKFNWERSTLGGKAKLSDKATVEYFRNTYGTPDDYIKRDLGIDVNVLNAPPTIPEGKGFLRTLMEFGKETMTKLIP